MASFAFPVKGTIIGATVSTSQTSAAVCSLNASTAPTSGVIGGDRAQICTFGQNAAVLENLDFPIEFYQNVYIDVKVAATFTFFVKV